MKYLISFVGSLVRMAVWALFFSAIISMARLLLGAFSLCNTPTWLDFLFGALGIFIFLFAYACCHTALTMYRYHKDPEFEELNKALGISWHDYKRLNNKPRPPQKRTTNVLPKRTYHT